MIYHSQKHGPIEIQDMPLPHIKNALAKLQRSLHKTSEDYELIGAFKQAIEDRETNPSNEDIKKDLQRLEVGMAQIKQMHRDFVENGFVAYPRNPKTKYNTL